ncbi:MAG: LysR family transcriptional regulator [Theionarchaea archaeon]|nr:MAG: hypothetical protein AYK18_09520 [Theionarchaea archaeon DG-70]MBU7009316.1 LysR family transcriptional regulator [Theionarchaea archaeon]
MKEKKTKKLETNKNRSGIKEENVERGKKSFYRPRYKLWLESDHGNFIVGEGTAQLLQAVKKEGSISEAARSLQISYAHAWRKIREIEQNLKTPVVERKRGGKTGGSSALTAEGEVLLQEYEQLKRAVEKVLDGSICVNV